MSDTVASFTLGHFHFIVYEDWYSRPGFRFFVGVWSGRLGEAATFYLAAPFIGGEDGLTKDPISAYCFRGLEEARRAAEWWEADFLDRRLAELAGVPHPEKGGLE